MPRPETGVMQFKDDWPGVFIREDDALKYARAIRGLIGESDTGTLNLRRVAELGRLLQKCDAHLNPPVQAAMLYSEGMTAHSGPILSGITYEFEGLSMKAVRKGEEVAVYVQVNAANFQAHDMPNIANVKLSFPTLSVATLQGEHIPGTTSKHPVNRWPTTRLKDNGITEDQETVAIAPGEEWTGCLFQVPAAVGEQYTIEITLTRKVADAFKFGGLASAAGVAIDHDLESAS